MQRDVQDQERQARVLAEVGMAIDGAAALGVHAQQANRQGRKHQTRALAEAGMVIDGTGAAQGVHHAGQGAQHV